VRVRTKEPRRERGPRGTSEVDGVGVAATGHAHPILAAPCARGSRVFARKLRMTRKGGDRVCTTVPRRSSCGPVTPNRQGRSQTLPLRRSPYLLVALAALATLAPGRRRASAGSGAGDRPLTCKKTCPGPWIKVGSTSLKATAQLRGLTVVFPSTTGAGPRARRDCRRPGDGARGGHRADPRQGRCRAPLDAVGPLVVKRPVVPKAPSETSIGDPG
jgi:hypothetical protein